MSRDPNCHREDFNGKHAFATTAIKTHREDFTAKSWISKDYPYFYHYSFHVCDHSSRTT
jgi:hypothetical protein